MGLYDRDYMRKGYDENKNVDEVRTQDKIPRPSDSSAPSWLIWLIVILAFFSIVLTLYFSFSRSS